MFIWNIRFSFAVVNCYDPMHITPAQKKLKKFMRTMNVRVPGGGGGGQGGIV